MLLSPFFHPCENFLTQLLPPLIKFLHAFPAFRQMVAILAAFSFGPQSPREKMTLTRLSAFPCKGEGFQSKISREASSLGR